MYFKKLELTGFKSFAEKTTLEFPAGVTAIVGPNGCGKSNIADSIRWVLGEQSVKSLRGSDMQDVIFNGSSVKEPLNFAEVSLTLSNTSKILPIEYDEVVISRRLYRSGESEYLLNQNTVRLKDIHELLLGTGVGLDSYAIVEQGKMDVILNARPEDRRVIFEEAAGITKYKSKKKEALRKIEQTDENLLRVNDILQEVKRQIGSLERQAKKAENYKKEFEKLKNLELWSASKEFFMFQNQKQSKEDSRRAVQEEEARCVAEAQSAEERTRVKRESFQQIEEALKKHDLEEMSVSADVRKNQDRILLNRERVGELSAKKENLIRQIEASRRRIQTLGTELDTLLEQSDSFGNEETQKDSVLAGLQAAFTAVEDEIRLLQGEQASKEGRSREIQRELSRFQTAIAQGQTQSSGLAHRRKKLLQDQEALLKEIRQAEDALQGSLFDGLPKTSEVHLSAGFESRIRQFKDKLIAILRRLASSSRGVLNPDEETELDGEIKVFADEISAIKVKTSDSQVLHGHWAESKKKAEEKIALIEAESRALLEEENRLEESAKKNEAEIHLLGEEERASAAATQSLEEQIRACLAQKEHRLVGLTESRLKYSQSAERRERFEKDKERLLESKISEESLCLSYENEIMQSVSKREALENESKLLEEEVARLLAQRDDSLKSAEGIRRLRQEAAEVLSVLEKERDGHHAVLDDLRRKSHQIEMEALESQFEMDRLKERIFNSYQVDLLLSDERADLDQSFFKEMLDDGESGELPLEIVKAAIRTQKEKLNKIGPVNLVAIEEFDEMQKRFEFLSHQQEDLLKAKDDLHKAILKINRTTRELFTESFKKVQEAFTQYYRLLFGGGSAELVLLDEEDVLECGIEIVARPPGKKLQNISLLSGGEKALTAVALLFALFKVRPSPFCVLDEIDAPLDEANVDRFCGVLKEFISQSQFITITHNKRTMHLADALYGITMAANGVSKIVSVKFSDQAVPSSLVA